MTDPRLLLLSPEDNVLVLRRGIEAGERFDFGAGEAVADRSLSLGHKVARRDIAAGEPILKYGAVIGVATEPIAAGGHVHVHNVRSNYTPTYSLPDEGT
ncbi:UxaA family hydrolase [Nisaea sediminum]|uniref:UxaA family hydrolase n=1 Tax=Nisaea sediminum TaxID=2775867 RepID=UPI0018696806|nr:UxaA family hydrolase [Nisaea sediminum]